MKIQIILSLVLIPLMAFSQRNAAIETNSGFNFTNYNNRILNSTEGRLNYDFGVALAIPMKNKHREWSLGLRFMAYGDKYDSGNLNWGSQHDGQGGHNPNLPGENVTSVKQISNFFYLEMPATIRQNLLNGKVRMFLQASAGPSIFLTGRNDNSYELASGGSQSAISATNTSDFRRINIMTGLGLGLEIPISQQLCLQFLPHGQAQLLSITDITQNNSKWYAFGIRGGVRYRLY